MKRFWIILLSIAAVLALCGGFSSCARGGAAAPPDTGFEILATPPADEAAIVVTTDFSALATVNEQGESVFALSVGDFIECYNGVYRQYYGKDYLKDLSSEGWQHWSELSPRFGYEATRYEFSADRSVWPMPTMSVYATEDNTIYEVRMTFDDHGYQDDLHALYTELCGCLLKMACPALSDAEIDEAFRELYALSDENFFGDHHEYGDPERPPLTKLLAFGSVGFYCFYGAGNIEICMIPLTAPAMETLPQAAK